MPDSTQSPYVQLVPAALLVQPAALLLLGLMPLAGAAQHAAALTGYVHTETGLPVEFATLTLHRATDSVVVKTEFSDARGEFR